MQVVWRLQADGLALGRREYGRTARPRPYSGGRRKISPLRVIH